jgi:hypothetical protein
MRRNHGGNMNTLKTSFLVMAALASAHAVGCSDSADDDNPGTTAAASGTPGAGGGTSSGSTGTGTTGGGGSVVKPVEDFEGPVTADRALTADKDWLMKGLVYVEPGATLTIEPGTKIMGEKASLGTLVVKPGARIVADGTADAPIVFTSQAEPGDRAAGDWGGVVILGRAPINVPEGSAEIEGIIDPGGGTNYGGDAPTESSGTIRYVRIEFSGIEISTDNEINGLTFGGVGSGTIVDYVQVRSTLDDCFEFFGGTVNAKHLVCTYNQDDGFDWDFGWTGKLQFVALQQDPSVADDTNGFEGDNDADASLNAPLSEPTIYNATLCGKNTDVDKQQYGMLLRRSTRAHIKNTIVTGFEAGVDVRDATTDVDLTHSIFFGNVVHNVAYAEDASNDSTEKDDDAAFDERAWFLAGTGNLETDPGLPGCFTPGAPNFLPAVTLGDGAATPPNDGFFDASATYIGAFKSDDTWATGAWLAYEPN